MRTIKTLLGLFILSSCSTAWHYKRIQVKDPNFWNQFTDTVKVEVRYNDTIWGDNGDTLAVIERVIYKDVLVPVQIGKPTSRKDVQIEKQKTKQIKAIEKNETKRNKDNTKRDAKVASEATKQAKHEAKRCPRIWMAVLWSILLGIVIGLMLGVWLNLRGKYLKFLNSI